MSGLTRGLEFDDLILRVCVQREAWWREGSAGGIALLRFVEEPDTVLFESRRTVAC
jgi:hypothetical protein